MLSLLHIENIAVIEQADITFDRGFNVLSGETGAGKSIIIDAISAILGERTYRESIRTGADKAFVSAVFWDVPRLDWFEENHVPFEPELQVQREIFLDGRNVCRVNGQGVSVSVLRALGRQLISIHGQHDSQQLFDEERHLALLDSFAADQPLLAAYEDRYKTVRNLQTQVQQLSLDEGEKLRLQESLQYQINELERANLQPGEDEALEAQQRKLQHAEKLMNGLNSAVDALYGDESSQGAADLLDQALQALSGVSRFDPALSDYAEKVQQLVYGAQDTAQELREYRDSLSDWGEDAERVGERLDLIHKLRRKYGATCEQMLAYLESAREKLDSIVFADVRKAELEKQLSAAKEAAAEAGEALHSARAAAAEKMEQAILKELADLNMPRVRFCCEFSRTELTAVGTDSVRFLMSANVGEAMKPLSKVASGGELARIMLAIKNVLASQDAIGTMIFDEVDAGVSGRAAQKVAEKLLAVSRGRQVLCVTHLPQIAALAENHLLISKSVRQERTYTQVTPLDTDGRVEELARMIGGTEITETTLRSAAEMLRR